MQVLHYVHLPLVHYLDSIFGHCSQNAFIIHKNRCLAWLLIRFWVTVTVCSRYVM